MLAKCQRNVQFYYYVNILTYTYIRLVTNILTPPHLDRESQSVITLITKIIVMPLFTIICLENWHQRFDFAQSRC